MTWSSTETSLTSSVSIGRRLLGRETLAAVEADARAVEHRGLDDRDDEPSVFLRATHALREGGVLRQHVGELVGDALRDARAEQARRDRDDADAQAPELARHRERHPRDAGLRGRVRDLPDLT